MPGAASGEFTVKSCGNAHAWCGVCRPEQAARQRVAPRPRKERTLPCRNCGRCDACLGLIAPEGQKICRTCRAAKPVEQFGRRGDTGGRRNSCNRCRNGALRSRPCGGCGKLFFSTSSARNHCARCRPPLTKQCRNCGKDFVGSMQNRLYCSTPCAETAGVEKRKLARVRQRLEALQAYSAEVPFCSCCGETELIFLAIDHINGNGHAHRKEVGGGGFYVWLRKHKYPAGFQVLCHNCNFGRQLNGGVCPHITSVRSHLAAV